MSEGFSHFIQVYIALIMDLCIMLVKDQIQKSAACIIQHDYRNYDAKAAILAL